MRQGEFDHIVTAGYQNTSTGRRLAPVAYWSDAAFQRALRIPEYLAASTAAQRRLFWNPAYLTSAAMVGHRELESDELKSCSQISCPPLMTGVINDGKS